MMQKVKQSLFTFAKTPIADLIADLAIGKLNKLIPLTRLSDNKYCVAFEHPKPSYKTHILIVPKTRIKNLTSLKDSDEKYISECIKTAGEIAKDLELEKGGYSLIVNGGINQKVQQLHFHLITK